MEMQPDHLLCDGYSKFIRDAKILALFKVLWKSCKLNWLIILMSYRRFANLREMFRRELGGILMRGIISRDFANCHCNYNYRSKANGECAFKENYRSKSTECKVTYRVSK